MENLNEINSVTVIAAIISLLALSLNLVIFVISRKESVIAVENQLTNHFLNIDDLLVKFPHLSEAYKDNNRLNNVFSKFDKTLAAFAYKHINIFAEVYETYFIGLSEQQIKKKRNKNIHAEHWYNFIERSLNTDTLLKQIIKEIIAENPQTKDYSEEFQEFVKKFF